MQLQRSITISADPERVWDFFNQPERVARCMPGAELREVVDDGEYEGALRVKFGPKTVSFTGKATFHRANDRRSGSVIARGSDRRGSSKAQMQLDFALHDDADSEAGGTRIDIEVTLSLSGPLSQFAETGGARLMESMMHDFSDCAARSIEDPTSEDDDGNDPLTGRRLFRRSGH